MQQTDILRAWKRPEWIAEEVDEVNHQAKGVREMARHSSTSEKARPQQVEGIG